MDFIKKYKTLLLAVLAVFATLAALTATGVDDKLIAAATTFVENVEAPAPVAVAQ